MFHLIFMLVIVLIMMIIVIKLSFTKTNWTTIEANSILDSVHECVLHYYLNGMCVLIERKISREQAHHIVRALPSRYHFGPPLSHNITVNTVIITISKPTP